MKKVYLIHGFEGSPNGGWRPYLMRELEKHDIYSFALSMPTPDKPIMTEWLSEIKHYVDRDINDEIYLVGHSLGGTAILRYLEQFDSPNIKGVVIVSAPCSKNDKGKIADFLKTDFDWSVIKTKIQNVTVIHGDNDPLVPISDAEKTSQELNGELIIIPNGKHLNGSAGFTELPELLSALLKKFNHEK
jgi:predicted alpha/beta hydrolase family esterase